MKNFPNFQFAGMSKYSSKFLQTFQMNILRALPRTFQE